LKNHEKNYTTHDLELAILVFTLALPIRCKIYDVYSSKNSEVGNWIWNRKDD